MPMVRPLPEPRQRTQGQEAITASELLSLLGLSATESLAICCAPLHPKSFVMY